MPAEKRQHSSLASAAFRRSMCVPLATSLHILSVPILNLSRYLHGLCVCVSFQFQNWHIAMEINFWRTSSGKFPYFTCYVCELKWERENDFNATHLQSWVFLCQAKPCFTSSIYTFASQSRRKHVDTPHRTLFAFMNPQIILTVAGKGADSTKISIYLICALAFNVHENWFTILVAATASALALAAAATMIMMKRSNGDSVKVKAHPIASQMTSIA